MGLMDNATTYSKLVSRYGQFRVPAFQLLIEGKILPESVGVERVEATLSLDGASAVSFTVAGAYDRKSSGFLSSVNPCSSWGPR